MRSNGDEFRKELTATFPLVNDHPDVAGVLRDADLLGSIGAALAAPYRNDNVTAVIAPEARGPILGALVAVELGAGLILARKDGCNHPGADLPVESAPTWRGEREVFQGRSFDLSPSDRVLIVDDWITTGSTIRAVGNIIRLMGAKYLGASVMVNKSNPATIEDLNVQTLVNFDDLVNRNT